MNKHIGIIKWFHDKARNANYGFIDAYLLGDVFFHESSLNDKEKVEEIAANKSVIFSIKKSRKENNVQACDVQLLSSVDDSDVLIKLFISMMSEENGSRWIPLKDELLRYCNLNLKTLTNSDSLDDLYLLYKRKNLEVLESDNSYKSIVFLIDFCEKFFANYVEDYSSFIEPLINDQIFYELWLNNLAGDCNQKYLAKILLTEGSSNQIKVMNKLSSDKLKEIFKQILDEDKGGAISLSSIKGIFKLIKFINSSDTRELMTDFVIKISTDYQNLMLWLLGYHDYCSFDRYKVYTAFLSPENQELFVKKLLKLIHEGVITLSMDQFTSIITVDYELSKSLLKSNNFHLDYSMSIVLNLISNLHKQNQSNERKYKSEIKKKLFEIILDNLSDPSDVIEISGYFDECHGRYIPSYDDENNFLNLKNTGDKPKLHARICDGRKFVDKDSKPVLCEKSGLEYWWCGNQRCYKPSRIQHSSDDWKQYTLLDFLTILQVDFREVEFEIYLSTINSVNRFLEHMKCKNCKWVLRPVNRSNYAFYGVTNFYCKNTECSEFEKEIYLTHCLNSNCENTIDSRNLSKCNNGWYICDYCYSCCSTSVIESRKENLHKRGLYYKGDLIGHREKAEMFCSECGNQFSDNKGLKDEYEKVLNWFIENKLNSKYISKSGYNQNNKQWFVFNKEDLNIEKYRDNLQYYQSLGFVIPNIHKENIMKQLIVESNDIEEFSNSNIKCDTCNNYIDLKTDFERYTAIKKFHSIRFPNRKKI